MESKTKALIEAMEQIAEALSQELLKQYDEVDVKISIDAR